MPKSLTISGSVILLLIGGGVTFFVLQVYNVGISNVQVELNLLEPISLVITIWLAIYIKNVLDRKSESRNHLSLIFSSKIERMIIELDLLKKDLDETSILEGRASSFSRLLASHKSAVMKYMDRDKRFSSTDKAAFDSDCKTHIRNLRDLLTNVPQNQTAASDILLNSGRYNYSDSRISLIISDLNRIESLLINLQLKAFGN